MCVFSGWLLAAAISYPSEGLKATEAHREKKNMAEYFLVQMNPEISHFQIDDGSTWEIDSKDSEAFTAWSVGDSLGFFIQQSWAQKERFVFRNNDKNSSVRASLISTPNEYRGAAQWIAYIDPSVASVFLGNGATFSLYPRDVSIFKNWHCDDFILVGDYDVSYTPYTHILFNFRTQEYSFAEVRQGQ